MTEEPQRSSTQGLTTPGQGRPLEAVRVEAVEGPGKGPGCTLSAGTLFIGSDASADLVLSNDPHVSRRHASIELLPGALQVRDLESRNGTFYLGARISEARVPLGGAIRLGRTTLQFRPVAEAQPSSARRELHGLVGESLAMRRLFAVLERIGPSDCAVLISGETGAGKERVARALHALSSRAQAPFVPFDCAAATGELMESELFGHERGAFTGADRERAGLVERAHGGTLFLDEVGELPLELQPKLLRLLESREYRRVGGASPQQAELRVLASTRHDLKAQVAAGRFRGDLFFRLGVTGVEVPPLRERLEDIPVLARHFARETVSFELALAPATLVAFQCDPWPGNVRELRNAVQRVLALGSSEAPSARPAASGPLAYLAARDALLEKFERDYLEALLARHGKNLSEAAREAKIARSFLYKLLAKHGLKG